MAAVLLALGAGCGGEEPATKPDGRSIYSYDPEEVDPLGDPASVKKASPRGRRQPAPSRP